jgi:hypothetical protein
VQNINGFLFGGLIMKRLSLSSKLFLAALSITFLPAVSSNTLAGDDVNFVDYTTLANDWWRCNEPEDPTCEEPSGEPKYLLTHLPEYTCYNVINIDLNGGPNDPNYVGTAAFAQAQGTNCVTEEWDGYYQGEGVMMTSPRCTDIGMPVHDAVYSRAVLIVDPCTHGYISGEPNLLGDGFVKSGGGPDPALFMYGNWSYGGIFDVYVLASAPGSFAIRDGKGTIHGPNTLSGDSNESNWVEGQNYVKFKDVWIGGTNTRDANGPRADYLNNNEYLIDPNCTILSYTNRINGIQLASVKRRVRAAGPADPCIVAKAGPGLPREKVKGMWPVETPSQIMPIPYNSCSTNILCADYDAYYETNARGGEYDHEGVDAGWAILPDSWWPGSLEGYVDEDWAKDGYTTYIDTGEWGEYDIVVTSETKGRYYIKALVNCWWAAADIGIYVDGSDELGRLVQLRYYDETNPDDDMDPPEMDPNAVYWAYDAETFPDTPKGLEVNFFTGFHKLRWRQNAAYYDILGFNIDYVWGPCCLYCEDIIDWGLGLAGDINEDCYVNFEDLAMFADTWLQPKEP